jgi:glycosyltransferase involved in cell wall biosynthesis
MMSDTRPLRVLHIIDTLGSGGSERLVWDIVRLSDQTRVKHRVLTVFPDGYFGPFVYAELLRKLGAYGVVRGTDDPSKHNSAIVVRPGIEGRSPEKSYGKDSSQPMLRSKLRWIPQFKEEFLRGLPRALKKPLTRIWNFSFSIWRKIRLTASYFPPLLRIPAEYFRFRPDIIHAHGFYSFKYGLVLRKFFGRPMLHMVPALSAQMEAQGTGWLVGHYRRFHHLVDCFALDPGYCSELLGVGVPAEKLFEISGTLDLQAIARVKAEGARHRVEVRTRLGIPENAIIALSVGRLDPTKGHSYTIEALPQMLKQFPNLHWVLLGEGANRSGLEKQIRELGVEQHAHLIGFDREPLPYYAAADIYLRTTTMESENISSLQAIAMGLPTVGFDSYRPTDLIGKLGHGILVRNADADALATASCQILSLPDRGLAMGALGIDYCNATLGIQKYVDNLLSVYANLHGKGRMARGRMAGLITDR